GHSFGAPVLPHHYADLGVTFTGQQLGYFHSSGLFNDGEGIRSNNDTLWATFDEPQRAIAVDYPGQIRFQLYSNGQLIFTSILFSPGMGQTQAFAGLISDQSFDAVHLYRVNSTYVYIDDLHFGIPTPGALSVFALTAFGCRRRRRS
ncbi:MAG TPA: hypothetical protein PK400_09405, partial [Phycisphaerales bacterium]|nr:hypothetical protein [Phycisphaerales bacterium]